MIQDIELLSASEAIGLLEQCGIRPPMTGKTHGPFRIDPVQWLCNEVEAGRLVFHDHTGLNIGPGEYAGNFGWYEETTGRKELNAWLERIGHLHRIPEPVAPSVAVEAPTPAPSASAPTVAAPEPTRKQKKPRRSWWDDIVGYLAEVLRAGKHRTAKALHEGVQELAGGQNSPFKVVCRKLYVSEVCQTLSVKTLQNRWEEVRAAAGMR